MHMQAEMPEPQGTNQGVTAVIVADGTVAAAAGGLGSEEEAGAVAQVHALPSMLEKLTASEQQRKAKQEQRRQEAQELVNPQENVQAFIQSFASQQTAVKSHLDAAHTAHASGSTDAVQTGLDTAGTLLLELEQRLADSSYFLPSWDLKACTLQLQESKASLESARASLVPKKRFAFSSKKVSRVKGSELTTARAAEDTAAATAAAQPAPHGQSGSDTVQAPQSSEPSAQDIALVAAGQGIADLHGQVIVRTQSQLSGQDFVIMNCTGCTVYLLGCMGALRLLHLKNCTVCTGPVPGATFVDDVQGCTLVLASYQVRIHRAIQTDLHLRVRSRPIIEHSNGVRVGPYNLQDDGVQGLLQQHKLGEETGMWQCVDDFDWIKTIHSPNWSVLPEAEQQRVMQVDLASLPAAEQ